MPPEIKKKQQKVVRKWLISIATNETYKTPKANG